MTEPLDRDIAARLAQDAVDAGKADELVARVVQVEQGIIAEFLRSPAARAVLLRHELTDEPGFCGGCQQTHQGCVSHLLEALARATEWQR